jgi:tetratricopeptide (TPR) repeat protein
MVHNGYLQAAVSAGLPALALYVGLIAAVILAGWRAMQAAAERFQRALTLAMLGAIAAYLVQDLSGWLEVSLTGSFWILLGLSVSYSRAVTGDKRVRSVGTLAIATLAAAALTVGAVVAAARTAQEWEAEAALAECREHERQGDWNLASACLDGVVTLHAGAFRHLDDVALFHLRDLDRHGDSQSYARAAVLLDGALRANPYDSYAAMHRVDLETVATRRGLEAADPAAIDAALRSAREADPTNPLVDESEARLRLAQGRTDDALALVRKAQAVLPGEGRLRVLEGDVHQASGETEAATAAYREAIGRLPAAGSLEARRKLSALLAQAGRLEEALGELDRAVGLAPNDGICRTLLGIIHEGMGEFHLARAEFRAALQLSPGDSAAREGLDRVTRMLDEVGRAERPEPSPSAAAARK